jgi:DNA-binding NarL/FixJ family response regulator
VQLLPAGARYSLVGLSSTAMTLQPERTQQVVGPLEGLTPRQRQIADLIRIKGLSVVAIAGELGMPIATARAHVRGIARRLPNPNGLPAYRLIRTYAP